MATEWDPYAQHNEVPEVGYIDPPSVPYRYVSPLRRETIYEKNSVSKVAASHSTKTGSISTPVKKSIENKAASPSELLASLSSNKVCSCGRPIFTPASCEVATQTTLTMERIAELEGKKVSVGPAVRQSESSIVRSSSGKRVAVIADGTKPRSKSNSRAPGSEAPVVAAPRATRPAAATIEASPGKSVPTSTVTGLSSSPQTSTVSILSRNNNSAAQQLLDVTPAIARKMFSGSNGLRSTSSNKANDAVALKRGKSSERVATLSLAAPSTPPSSTAGPANAALQAAMARNLLRKQAASNKPTQEQFSAQNSSTATTGRRHVPEFTSQAPEASPARATNLVAQLPTALSSPIPVSLAKSARGVPTPTTASLNAPASRFSRGPSLGSVGASSVNITNSQRRGTSAAQKPVLATATTAGVQAPSRTLSSKPIVRKPIHVDPSTDVEKELKKAQGANHQIAHMQASLEGREKARQWQQAADEKVAAPAEQQ